MLPKDKLQAFSRRFSLAFGQVFHIRSRPGGAANDLQLEDVEAPMSNPAVEREAAVAEGAPPAYCSIMW